jgi:hypothetical protein
MTDNSPTESSRLSEGERDGNTEPYPWEDKEPDIKSARVCCDCQAPIEGDTWRCAACKAKDLPIKGRGWEAKKDYIFKRFEVLKAEAREAANKDKQYEVEVARLLT